MRAVQLSISAVRHALGAATEGFLVASLIAMAAIAFSPVYAPARSLTDTGTAFAAKGGHGGVTTSTVTITVANGVFGGTTTATTSPSVWVHASCSQNGAVVYEQYVTTDASGNAVLKLGPTSYWSSGAASCSAAAGVYSTNGTWRTLATTTFSVSG